MGHAEDVTQSCPHGFDSPAWCADCQRTASTARKARRGRAGTIAARFPGACAWCDSPIEPGDPIAPEPTVDGRGGGGWVCADCHEETD